MRNLKKFLALVLAFVMAMSLMITVNASSFTDDTDITKSYQEAVDVLTALGVISGYEDGSFQPKETITRAEVAAILYRIVTGDVGDKNIHLYENSGYFSDVADGKWYNGYVNYCANNGLVVGMGNDRFAPSDPVTGYETLVMVLRAMGYNYSAEFTGSDWKLKASGYGTRLGITKNISAGSLGGNATREMVVEIMFQAIQAPTVTYSTLLGYSNNVLVKAYQDGSGKWVYDKDVPETLLYRTFKIVGKRTILGSDGTYGRPVVEWVKDAKEDTVENGGKYIVNPQKAVETAASAAGDVYGIGADDTKNKVAAGAVYIPRTTPGATYAAVNDDKDGYKVNPDKTDEAVHSYTMRPYYTFNTAMTECDLSKAINNDKTISWSNITEYVNGGLVVNRNNPDDDDGTTPAHTESFDALHTTNTSTGNKTSDYTIGAAGRQTEIYKLDGDKWIFVYIDTLLGQVAKVVPHTLDTNGHVVKQAELWIAVNDAIDGSEKAKSIVKTQNNNYTQNVGDLFLLTTYGMKDGAGAAQAKIGKGADSLTAIDINYAILNAVPAGTKTDGVDTVDGVYEDFQIVGGTPKAASWAVDFASSSVGENSTVPTATITVDATVGLAADKTGVITNGKTYPTTWAYHVDHDGDVTDEFHTKSGVDVNDDTVLDTLCVNVTNQIIGQTFTVALDKNGNIVGMWQGTSDKMIGVVTNVDYARIGLGKYAVEMEIFTVDSKTETVRLLDAANNNSYFPTQEEADAAIKGGSDDHLKLGGGHNLNPTGALVELVSYTKDGATYWAVNDNCGATTLVGHATTSLDVTNDGDDTNATHVWGLMDTDGKVVPGKAETLRDGSVHTALEVNEETVFIVAEYDFRYNTGVGNQGSNVDVRYTVYNSFRDIPVIDGDAAPEYAANGTFTGTNKNISFQTLDGKLNGTEAKYVLISAFNPEAKYTMSKASTINPDNSFLVIAPIATYAQYSEYLVARNGVEDTIKVANVNNTVNEKLQNAIRVEGLMIATSENGAGYITDVELLKTIEADPTHPNYALVHQNMGGEDDTKIGKGQGLTHHKGVLKWDDGATSAPYTYDKFLTVAENCIVKIVNVDLGKMFDANLASIDQYQAEHDIVFELDSNGWVSCLYIID